MYDVNIAIDSFSILINVILIIAAKKTIRIYDKQNRLFLSMLLIYIPWLTFDIMAWALEGKPQFASLNMFSNFFVAVIGYLIPLVFAYYALSVVQKPKMWSKVLMWVLAVIIMAVIVGYVINLFIPIFSYINTAGHYIRGDYFWITSLAVAVIFINLLVLVLFQKELDHSEKISLCLYLVFPTIATIVQYANYGLSLVYPSTVLALLICYVNIQLTHEKQLIQKETELANARAQILMSQIQPHFILNAMSAVIDLCDTDPSEAKKAAIEFSSYLRTNINSLKFQRAVLFPYELNHVKNYLKLEKRRFGERLHIIYDIKCGDFKLPILSLQPIVENAVRCGVCKKLEGGTVIISTFDDEQNYYITVEDDGVGFDVEQLNLLPDSHVGIRNVRSRLETICSGTLTITSTPAPIRHPGNRQADYDDIQSGTKVVITIPKKY